MVRNPSRRKPSGEGRYLTGDEYNTVPAVNHRVSGASGDTICPVCGLTVNVLKSGVLGAHRVGRSARNAWPCPGGGTPAE